MKARSKIGLSLALTISALAFVPLVGHAAQTNAAEFRAAFRQLDFKTDLSDFNFAVPKELSDRAAALSVKGPVNMLRPITFLNDADLLTPVGDRAAIVIWKQEALAYPSGFHGYSYLYDPGSEKDVWPAERGLLEGIRSAIGFRRRRGFVGAVRI
jgi:hypothetical protein